MITHEILHHMKEKHRSAFPRDEILVQQRHSNEQWRTMQTIFCANCALKEKVQFF